MCDVDTDLPMKKGSNLDRNKFCIKCKKEKPVVLVRHSKFCKECFIFNFTGKFRTILSKSPIINDKSKSNVLLGVSGGPSSRALLHLVKNFCLGINKSTPKDAPVNQVQQNKNTKLGKVTVVHIDESAISPNHESIIPSIRQIVLDYGFDFKLIPLETLMDHFLPEEKSIDNKKRLQDLFNSTSQSTKDDLLSHFKSTLLTSLARSTNSNILMVGDSATRIAINTIGLTSEGRGFNIPFATTVETSFYPEVTILRPLKDVILKEVAFYNHYLSLYVPPLFQTHATKASIMKLTEHFIIGLDRGFPSTVSTVCRTASKLQPNPIFSQLPTCELCSNCIEDGVSEWRKGITVYSNSNNENVIANEESNEDDLINRLCYGCQTNFSEIKSNPNNSAHNLLPPYISSSYPQNVTGSTQNIRELMKNQIQEFLLD